MARKNQPSPPSWIVASQVGSLISGPAILGLVIDWLADCLPWFTVAGVLLGAISGFVFMVKWSNQSQRGSSSDEPNSPT